MDLLFCCAVGQLNVHDLMQSDMVIWGFVWILLNNSCLHTLEITINYFGHTAE